MTTKAGYYGSDAVENRFSDPKTNKAYFTLVNEKTGEIEIYTEEISEDKRVGTMEKDGSVVYNNTWVNSANENDERFIEIGVITGSIKNHAQTMVKDESGLNNADTKQLMGGNTSTSSLNITSAELSSGLTALQSGTGTDNANTKTSGFGNLVFPEKIRNTRQDVMKFNMMKYVPKDFNEKTFGFAERETKGRIIGSVILPIPAGISDSQAVQWGPDSMNPIQVALAQAALDGITEGLGAGIDSFQKSAEKVAANSEEAKAGIAAILAGKASGNQNLLTRKSGAIVNPNLELLFSAPSLRPFNFNFTLSPRNPREAQQVIRIIRFFKQGMAPIRSKSNLFLKSPHTFQLAYKFRGDGGEGRTHPFLNKFKECALQSFGVQYTPTGNYSTFSDGVMSQYNITMTFTELEPVFNDDYGTGNPVEVGF